MPGTGERSPKETQVGVGAGFGVGWGGVGSQGLQLSRGLGDSLRDLRELQARALHHTGLTTALVGAGHIASTLAVQVVILRPCSESVEELRA